MSKIVIIMDEGIVQEVICDSSADVLVIDRDAHIDEKEQQMVLGELGSVYTGLYSALAAPDLVDRGFSEAGRIE